MSKIGFIGLGKLGLDCAEVFATKHQVWGHDVMPRSSELVRVTTAAETIKNSDWIFIAVPTPHAEGYDGSVPSSHMEPRDFGHDAVIEAIDSINERADAPKRVVLISTVLPGTTRRVFRTRLDSRHHLIYNPYLIAMGSVKWDMVNPEMVIIGTQDGDRTDLAGELVDLYGTIMQNQPRYEIGTWDECEAIKIFYNCYSSDTEVLTSSGWKLFKDATPGDLVLSLDSASMIPEWIKPEKFVSRDYKGTMIHFTSSKDDILVTPGHNMLYGTQQSTADEGYSCSYQWKIAPAEEIIKRKSFVFQRSTKWHNNSPESITVNGITLPTPVYVQFMAWYLAEGCLSNNRIIISQDQQTNSEKYEMIREVFNAVYHKHPSKHTRRLLEGNTGFSVLWDELAEYLQQFGKSFDKFIPDNIKQLGIDMIRLFLDTYNLADGSAMSQVDFEGNVTHNRRYKYYATSSDQMAADLGELIIKVGRFPSYRSTQTEWSNKPCHLIYELVSRTSSYQKSSTNGLKFYEVDYDDKVYCAVLPKNHIFLTRRNGKCTWQGNTFISAKVGLANMIQDFAMRIGNINVDVVTDALARSTMRIMGPKYMTAGMGDSGACHPRDNIALRWLAKKYNLGYDMFDTIMHAREIQARNLAEFLIQQKTQPDMPIVIHGKAYKPDVPYCIGSYSTLVGHYVSAAGHELYYVDPMADDQQHCVTSMDRACVVLMAHNRDVTYGYTGEAAQDRFYFAVPSGSCIVDPWRRLGPVPGCQVTYYGNTRSG